MKEKNENDKVSAFPIHTPFAISIFFGFFISLLIYYQTVLRSLGEGTQTEILGYSDIQRYVTDPVCLIIFGLFLAVVFYFLIQWFALKADKSEFETLLDNLDNQEPSTDSVKEESETKPEKSTLSIFYRYIYILAGRNEGDMYDAFHKTFDSIRGSTGNKIEWCRAYIEFHHGRLIKDLYFLQYGVWVLPIFGFIGTVLGISRSIAGLSDIVATTEQQMGGALQTGMQKVLDGLSTAFDTTFLGLALTVLVMFAVLFLNRVIHTQMEMYYLKLVDRLNRIEGFGPVSHPEINDGPLNPTDDGLVKTLRDG